MADEGCEVHVRSNSNHSNDTYQNNINNDNDNKMSKKAGATDFMTDKEKKGLSSYPT